MKGGIVRLVLAIAVLMAAGCVTLQPVQSTPTVLTNYSVGVVCSAGIGDAIVDVQSASKIPQFVALRAHDPGRLRTAHPKIQQGQTFRATGRLKNGNYVIESAAFNLFLAVVVSPEGRALGYYDDRGGARGGTWPKDPLFAPAEGLAGQENAFRAQLIYSGLDGRTIRATYREFSGDFIRPAFAQEVQYNLAQDSTIAYKTIKIQVLEATNSVLRYRVREDGGLPWLPGGRVPAVGQSCRQLVANRD
jgi:hypothetical protein